MPTWGWHWRADAQQGLREDLKILAMSADHRRRRASQG